MLHSGDIGLAETVSPGLEHAHLADLLRLLMANRDALESVVYGAWWRRLAYRLRHLLNRDSRAGNRRDVHAHYDLGNAFYQLWLDPTMNYSSGLVPGRLTGDLTAAQHAKVRRALRSAGVQPGRPRAGNWLRLGRAGRNGGGRVSGPCRRA